MKSPDKETHGPETEPARNRSFFDALQVEFLVHELKDPIAVIETGVRALLERTDKYGPITGRQKKTLNRILRSTRKTREMLYGLLEVGRSEAGFCVCCVFDPIRVIHEVLLETVELTPEKIPEDVSRDCDDPQTVDFLAEIGVRLSVDSELSSMPMQQDETKFRQIVGNLVKNGLHHRRNQLEIRIERRREMLCLSVTDDGPGVDPRYHRMIFERYAQVQECEAVDRKGHGLGLAGALALARCLGGEITIESNKGQGATFCLKLPFLFKEGQ